MLGILFISALLEPQDSLAYPGILFGGGWGSTNSVEDRARGSGGSCNLVQEISFRMVKFS